MLVKALIRPVIILLAVLPLFSYCQNPDSSLTGDKTWITKSNEYTQHLIDIDEKYAPEFGSEQGLAFFDTLIAVPTLINKQAERKEKEAVLVILRNARIKETNSKVKQDLNILINQSELDFKLNDFELNREVTYLNATATVFDGIHSILDEQTPAVRYDAAVTRLRKYAGIQNGYQPLTEILKERTIQQMNKKDMIYPSKQDLETALSRNESILDGTKELFIKYKIRNWDEPYNIIKKQLDAYDQWVRTNILPKARIDFRLDPEKYKLQLISYGIDIPPADLAKTAHDAFTSIQDQMNPIAKEIAKKYDLPSSDYRTVIRFLKKNQIIGDSIMIIYKEHLKDIEDIIRNHRIVTLPTRDAMIQIATAAETVRQPAPHMKPPPFLNNTGQYGVFILPMNMPTAPGEKIDKYDDFSFEAACWTLIAHEARPGHELQFDKMVEEGVSHARVLYAFNSTNVEGWGLYSEYLILPYMPLEGKLISLDYRLLRAARAFLDPELQAGIITQDQAMDILMNDVITSHAMAKQEVERYTLRAPGQANSYFYGFTKMITLRKDTEAVLGTRFNQQRFHDFILAQGILPPALVREAVMNDLVNKEK
jgi:hypothetical protein